MRTRNLTVGVVLALASQAAAGAEESIVSRLDRLEAENRALRAALNRHESEIRRHRDAVAEQQATIAEQKAMLEGTPERLKEVEAGLAEAGGEDAWYRNIEIAGLIEVEAGYTSPFEGDDESDIVLATFELGVSSQITAWVEAGAALLYEEDETDLEVDIAYVTLFNDAVAPVFATAGQVYVPFGAYETQLVSDPLTLEIGETRETSLQLGFVQGSFMGSVYAFNGENDVDGESQIGGWGGNLGYAYEGEDRAVTLGVGYLNDLGDSDSLQDLIADNRVAAIAEGAAISEDPTERTGGWTLNAAAALGPFTLIGEYLAATGEFDMDSLQFDGDGARPSAWNIEAGYAFPVMGRESVAAIAYQGTSEALALELPEERWMLGWSVAIFDNTALSFEWAHDNDYSESKGGTGESADTFVAQLAVEF